MKFAAIAVATLLLAGCCEQKNQRAEYGETTGLPKNCRAIVQANIDGYRAGTYTADEIISSLERNCGANGYAWNE